jgi:hypothetical protein
VPDGPVTKTASNQSKIERRLVCLAIEIDTLDINPANVLAAER